MLPIARVGKIYVPHKHELMRSKRNNYVCQVPHSLGFRLFLRCYEKELSGCLSDFPPWLIL